MISAYPIRIALSGIWREKWINLLCVFSIATGLLLIALAVVFVYNLNAAIGKLPDRFAINVFLQDGLSQEGVERIVKEVKGNPSIVGVKHITSDEALKELKSALKDSAYVLEGLEGNPLPASLEIKVSKDAVSGEAIKGLSLQLRQIKGVADVDYGEKMLSVIQSARRNSESFGALLVGSLSAAVLFVCYSTVKILLYRKNDEVETLKLLGATSWFIRMPFLIEGSVLGFAGGMAGSLCMLLMYKLLYARLTEALPLLNALGAPQGILLWTPVAGLAIGLAGAFIALGRIKL